MNAASAPALAEPAPAPRPGRWADLRLRVASAAVLAPLALLCAWFGGPAWLTLVAVAGFGVCWEWAHMAGWRPITLLAGFIYTGLAMAALAWLRTDPSAGRGVLLFVVMLVWSSDIGAYVAGRLIGGRRLAPAISPGKTWSGAAGGLLAALLAGAAAAWLWGTRFGPVAGLAIGLGVASQLGDLLESAVKRHFGVKDSGKLIPGHGGLLDRLDGLMAAALLAWAWGVLVGWAGITGQGATNWH